jgi:TRAP transporter 4TM/12TM fusion protein
MTDDTAMTTSRLRIASPLVALTSGVAVVLGVYHLYTAVFGTPPAIVHRAIHLGGMAFVGYATLAADPLARAIRRKILLTNAVLAVAACGYLVMAWRGLVFRVGVPSSTDLLFAGLTVIVLLDLTRRLHGWPLVATAGAFLLYGVGGPSVPGFLAHRGYDVADILEFSYTTTEGIFGVPIQVSASYLVIFILFAAFLDRSGIIPLFNDLAFAIAGRTRGGVAKMAVLSSALMGTVNGSGLANVTTTGAVTIPMMKRHGFAPHYAAAVEATASMGGQIMPPVMGVAAFLMAERLGIPYARVALAAIVPAVLYFLATGVQIHFHAVRTGMRTAADVAPEPIGRMLATRGHLLLPVAALIWLMMSGFSPLYAAVASIAVSLALSVVTALVATARRPSDDGGAWATRLHEALHARGASPRAILEALELGIRNTVSVAVACGVVGIIVGVVILTGAGLKLSSAIIAAAGGLLLPTLVLTMFACFVLGMGLPTIPTYIITSTMAAPALTRLGVDRLAADFFVMYFGVLANITPPVALAAYAAAGIARADPLKTCATAVRLSVAGFLVPYVFAYSPIMLGVGFSPLAMAHVVVTAVIGIVALGAAMEGQLLRPATWYERVLLVAAALDLIIPGWLTDLVGAVLLGAVIASQRLRAADPMTMGARTRA